MDSKEAFEPVLERLADGKTLREICKHPDMPNRHTFMRWINEDPERRKRYDLARQDGMDSLADELVEIAWDTSKDTITDRMGRQLCNHEWIARSRLKSETIRFLMSKINPRRYGEKMPDVIAAKEMDDERAAAIEQQPAARITRTIIDPPNHGLHERIRDLEAQLAERQPKAPGPPRQLTYDPGPLPQRMDRIIAERFVVLIRDHIRKDDQREALTVLEEVISVCRGALRDFYGPSGELFEMPPAA